MNIKKHIASVLLVSGLLAAVAIQPGCGTTPETKIAQGAQIVIHSVNDGMAEWTDYVNAGKAKQSQINIVKLAYGGYYTAMKTLNAVADKMAAKDPGTTQADLDAANNAVKTAEAALLNELSFVMNAVIAHN